MYLRMMRAHSAAALGEHSAASTIGGRKRTSSLYNRYALISIRRRGWDGGLTGLGC